MRQTKREITDLIQIEAVIQKAEVCRLALWDDGYPYIVPLNFGYADRTLYFHCALEGKKIELIRENSRAGFELESVAQIVPHAQNACAWSAKYQSVIGRGTVAVLDRPEEKRRALDVIMAHYTGEKRSWEFPDEHLGKMLALRLDIETMTGKQSKEFL